jgi:hypothetical protein
LFSTGLREEPSLTILAICPKVMQGQKQVMKPSKTEKSKQVNKKKKKKNTRFN